MALTLVALMLLTLGSCAQPRTGRASRGPVATARAPRTAAPEWSTRPPSWGKLDEIERWLAGPQSKTSDPYWRVEAKLQLAEGRLAMAGEEHAAATNPETIAFRRAAALEGFEDVLATPTAATTDQMGRARDGARALERLGVAAGPSAAAAAVPIAGLVTRAQWGATRANPRDMTPATARWDWITVHHSVFGGKEGDIASTIDTVRRIQRVHMKEEKYADIGYHFLIDREGRVIEGRSLRWQGAHADGGNNIGNVGICLLGNFEVDQPTAAAMRSLERLVVELQRELRIPRRNVRPHRAWKATDCPGRHLMPWFARF